MREPTDRDLDVALAVRDAIAADVEVVANAVDHDDETPNLGPELRAAIAAARGIAARIRAFNVEGVIPCE